MDKKLIFAVAGAGKTTLIVDSLNENERSLIVTYTVANYNNLYKKISEKFNGSWPSNVTLMTYFSFLFKFCYKPFLADELNATGITYEKNSNRFAKLETLEYYMSKNRYLYSNRIALLIETCGLIPDVQERIERYFDNFIVDEVQDISGRDFTFLEHIMNCNINMLFVGDFYQHTYDTSRDGTVNKKLFDNKENYIEKYTKNGICVDTTSLKKSWRCSHNTCDFVSSKMGIEIQSNKSSSDDTTIELVTDNLKANEIIANTNIIKLHYQKSSQYGLYHKNWGETKGEDSYIDVCVILNKTTAKKFKQNKLNELAQSTLNKLYVAITRSRRHVYFIDEELFCKLTQS